MTSGIIRRNDDERGDCVTTATGGELLARALREAGVTEVFTLHGGHLDAFLSACEPNGLRVTDTRHESSAGHAAEAYARLTGRPGVCVTTSGPGFTNTYTAIANAWLDAIPVLFVVGAPPLREQELNVLQGGFDQIEAARTVTKWAHRATNGERIPELVALALRHATTGKPGPVLLEVPIDVMFRPVPESWARMPAFPTDIPRPEPTSSSVAAAADALVAAERPVMVLGGGAMLSRCADEVLALAERMSIPVFNTNKGDGLLPATHPLYGGGTAPLLSLAAFGVGQPDVVVLAGCRQGMFTGGRGRLLADAAVIQIDVDAAEIGRIHDVAVPLVADCRQALRAIVAELARRGATAGASTWVAGATGVKAFHEHLYGQDTSTTSGRMHPYFAAKNIMAALPGDAILIMDGGESATWVDFFTAADRPDSVLRIGYLGTLGVGQGFAIGASRAFPDRPVVLVTGDGAVGFHIAEFDTMVRHDMPVVTIVFNNKGWGMSIHGQSAVYGAPGIVASRLADSAYEQTAIAFGGAGERVDKLEDLGDAMKRALDSDRPYCINAAVDGEIVHPITTALLGDLQATDAVVIPYYENLPLK